MTLEGFLLTLILFLDLVCIIAVIFLERRNPASSIAWVLVLIVFPVFGIIAYMLFGSGFHMNKRKRYLMKSSVDRFFQEHIFTRLKLSDSLSFIESNRELGRIINYLHNAGRAVFTVNNSADVYTDGDAKFKALLADMKSAKEHIHLLYYIFRVDELGQELLNVAVDKASQGVDVRILYDNVGNPLLPTPKNCFKELEDAGGEVLAFSPMRFSLLSQLRANYRNHRKIAVIDGNIGYVGGMNVGVEYLGKDKKLSPWRDTSMRLVGESVWFLQERFLMDWSYASDINIFDMDVPKYFPDAPSYGNLGVQVVSSGPDTAATAPIKGALLEMVYSARKNIYLQTPYFTPDQTFLEALEAAARAGVDVRVMIPGISDHMVVYWTTLNYSQNVLDAGVRVFKYNGFLHAKTLVCDGKVATIGTSNIGARSFLMNFEVNAFMYQERFAKAQEEIFIEDQKNCVEIDEKWFASRNVLQRAVYRSSRLLAPLM